ncbi:hypothetical protein [Catellatospora citrea]|uniref:Uncharacterized protein n=1 Tax=Catellatospora citrea TaxID=53366 RepID=A0A8J3P0Q4_9ACTN|nr:hypothetical protein [Catellatospora citrea]RKE05978.1 hypothetical protein C8E86_0792 [Catellatospora citrea]GIF97640.1 hypothetical protein Cci01nite_27340 [Catellatospora citrea]
MRLQQPRPADETQATPFGINLALGAVVVCVSTILAGAFVTEEPGRLMLAAAVTGVFAAVVADTRASLLTGLLGFLLFDGFLVNRFGELSWDGVTTLFNLTVFGVAVGVGLGQRWIRQAVARPARTPDADPVVTELITASRQGV